MRNIADDPGILELAKVSTLRTAGGFDRLAESVGLMPKVRKVSVAMSSKMPAPSGWAHQSTGLRCRQVTGPLLADAVLETTDGPTRRGTKNPVNWSVVVTQTM